MDFLSTANTQDIQQWIAQNWAMTALMAAVCVQWVALQALAIHYYLFRKNLKRPRPDRIRLATLERAVKFQEEQFERVFQKMAALREEVANVERASSRSASNADSAQSIENSFVTLGEMELQKRIRELQKNRTN